MDKVKISFIVVVYKMPLQAMNTLYTLSRQYQKNTDQIDYEVIVVENYSDKLLNADEVKHLGSEFKYFLRHPNSPSPVCAINFGIEISSGSHICLMIDGARMLTPRVVEFIHMGCKAAKHSLITVPGYSLGWQDQHYNRDTHYNEDIERRLLEKTNWKNNGYRLFDIAVLSGANINGFFNPFMECNCVTSSRENFERIGGADQEFQLPGGGSINLHMFRQLGLISKPHPYFVIGGEGSFHQYHGGVTTSQWSDLEEVLHSHRTQLHAQWPNGFSSLCREPILLGCITKPAINVSLYSSFKSAKRARRLTKQQQALWDDDKNNSPYWIKYESVPT